jgi:hypothetical protein
VKLAPFKLFKNPASLPHVSGLRHLTKIAKGPLDAMLEHSVEGLSLLMPAFFKSDLTFNINHLNIIGHSPWERIRRESSIFFDAFETFVFFLGEKDLGIGSKIKLN